MAGAAIVAAPDLPINPTDTQLLDAVQRRAFDFFWNESDPHTGITKDRAGNFAPDDYTVGSVASTGYALASLPIGVEHGWVTRYDAYQRALTTLRFFYNDEPNIHGWYYHFIDMHTGTRAWKCELSSIDTALFLAGALTAGSYFQGTEVDRLANAIYDRVDFDWMRTDGGTMPNSPSLCMGWKPESGWIGSRWDSYDEDPLLYLLAMGSPTHSLPPSAWQCIKASPSTVEGYDVIGGPGPLFIWQMPPGYFDFRGQRDRNGYDFWVNFVNANRANHAYCIRNPGRFKTYSSSVWAISANDIPDGYGAQDDSEGSDDGTVSPSGAIASICFDPALGRASLRAFYDQYREKIWGRYGFSDAMNADKNWYDKDVIGIDLGMMLIATENHRSGLVWRLVMRQPFAEKAMAAAGFHYTEEAGNRPLLLAPTTASYR